MDQLELLQNTGMLRNSRQLVVKLDLGVRRREELMDVRTPLGLIIHRRAGKSRGHRILLRPPRVGVSSSWIVNRISLDGLSAVLNLMMLAILLELRRRSLRRLHLPHPTVQIIHLLLRHCALRGCSLGGCPGVPSRSWVCAGSLGRSPTGWHNNSGEGRHNGGWAEKNNKTSTTDDKDLDKKDQSQGLPSVRKTNDFIPYD